MNPNPLLIAQENEQASRELAKYELSRKIQQHAYALNEAVIAYADVIRSPAYTWPKFIRRAYVLTFPVTAPFRLLIWILLGFLFIATGIGGTIASRLAHIWVGIKS